MTTKKPDPAKSREVAARLEEQILRSGMRAGWRLPSEEQLCRMHGVSRTVVREAVQQLKARGLVDSRRGGGTHVAAIEVGVVGRAMLAYAALIETPKAFEEILELRARLECECARELCRRRDKDAAARLKARLDAMRKVRDQPAPFVEAELAFHRQFAEESGNALLSALLDGMSGSLTKPALEASRAPERRDRALSALEALYEAIRTGNADAASALVLAHAAKENPALMESRAAK